MKKLSEIKYMPVTMHCRLKPGKKCSKKSREQKSFNSVSEFSSAPVSWL